LCSTLQGTDFEIQCMRNRLFFFCCLTLVFELIACKHDNADLSGLPKVCYNEVSAVYSICSKCHTGGEQDFSSYEGIMRGITPYEPLKSEYYTILVSEWMQIMPPDKPLSQEQRMLVRLWIEQGADSTTCQ
jgi:hypothetical protein